MTEKNITKLENLEKNLQNLKDERLRLSETYRDEVDNPFSTNKDKLNAILEVWSVDKKIVQGKIDIVHEHLLTSDCSEIDDYFKGLASGTGMLLENAVFEKMKELEKKAKKVDRLEDEVNDLEDEVSSPQTAQEEAKDLEVFRKYLDRMYDEK